MTQYIIMAQPKRRDADMETGKPLAYGRGTEPSKDTLLFRGRATAFATEQLAWTALERSLTASEAGGSTWCKTHQYFLVELVESA